MPVANSFIFCEGTPESLDAQVLDRVLSGSDFQIVPAGGKYGLKAFIQGYRARSELKRYIAFRDRDFDIKPPSHVCLLKLDTQQPIWTCYRACIESYLVDANLVRRFWEDPVHRLGQPPTLEAIDNIIVESARQIADYQAIRWALAELKPTPASEPWPWISTTWTKDGSGDLPQRLDFGYCLAQARNFVARYVQMIQGVTEPRLDEMAQVYREKFSEDEFYSAREFLIWFHGKDLLKVVCRNLRENFSYRSYQKWAAEDFVIEDHADLLELKGYCQDRNER